MNDSLDVVKATEEVLHNYEGFTGTKYGRLRSMTGQTGVGTITAGIPYLVYTPGTFDWSGLSTTDPGGMPASPPVGKRVYANVTTTLTGGATAIAGEQMGSFVKGYSYTILQLGSLSATTSNEWVKCGVRGLPYVGMQFICTKDPADQPTLTDAYATRHSSIGDRVFTNVGQIDTTKWNVITTLGYDHVLADITVRNQSLPSGGFNSTLNPDQIYSSREFYASKFDPANLEELKTNQDFWEDGHLQLAASLHPKFKDTEGGVVWEGYQSGYFDFRFYLNGFFAIEEDVNEDGNWKLLKGLNTFQFRSIHPVSWETDEGVTRLFFADPEDWKRVCGGHTVTIGEESYTIIEAYKSFSTTYGANFHYAKLDTDIGTSGYEHLDFSFDRSQNELWTGLIQVNQPARGKRRKVRYSCWWYEPDGTLEQQLEFKLFEHDNREGSTSMAYTYFYETSGENDVYGRYTFPYFMENHASPTIQDSTSKLTIDGSISSLLYVPKQDFEDVFPEAEIGTLTAGEIYLRIAKHTNTTGKLELELESGTGSPFQSASEGDKITFIDYDTSNPGWSGSNELWSYPLLERTNDNLGYVASSLGSASGGNVGLMQNIQFLLQKNEGMVGIYKASRVSDTELTIRLANSATGAYSAKLRDVTEGDLIYYSGIFHDPQNNRTHCNDKPYVVKSIDVTMSGDNEVSADITVFEHPSLDAVTDTLASAQVANLGSTHGIATIYSSRGLNDMTGVHECKGVFGVEVAQDNLLSDGNPLNELVLTDTNFDRMAVGDRVYFESAIPQPTQPGLSGSDTRIGSINSGTNTITLINDTSGNVNITANVNAGATIVIVPSGSYNGNQTELKKNREYCVIPLNTAPPFSSYSDGLQTSALFPNLDLKELAFKKLSYNPPADYRWTNSTLNSGRFLILNTPAIPGGFVAGDFVKILGSQSTGVGRLPSIHYDGRIYKVKQGVGPNAEGINLNCELQYWDGNSWEDLSDASGEVDGLLEGLTFVRLGDALSLEDIEFLEGTSDTSNRSGESSSSAQEPDSYLEISYTPPGGSTRTFRAFSNTRDITTTD